MLLMVSQFKYRILLSSTELDDIGYLEMEGDQQEEEDRYNIGKEPHLLGNLRKESGNAREDEVASHHYVNMNVKKRPTLKVVVTEGNPESDRKFSYKNNAFNFTLYESTV